MEQNTTIEESVKTAQSAEAEKNNGATDKLFAIGKFTSVEALYRAYERLQAEFTRRSQRLKALEEGIAEEKAKYTSEDASTGNSAIGENNLSGDGETARKPTGGQLESGGENENKSDGVFRSAPDKQDDYIDELVRRRSPASFCKGSAVYAPPFKPKTLAEAGELAREFIKVKGEF